MATYVFTVKFSPQQHQQQDGQQQLSRAWQNVQQAITQAGGQLKTGDCGPYAVLGNPAIDLFVIAELPNQNAATHASLAMQARGLGWVTTNAVIPDNEFTEIVARVQQTVTSR